MRRPPQLDPAIRILPDSVSKGACFDRWVSPKPAEPGHEPGPNKIKRRGDFIVLEGGWESNAISIRMADR